MFEKMSCLLATLASIVLCVAPVVSTQDLTGAGSTSLLQSQGWTVLLPLGFPVLIAALPLARLPAAGKTATRVASAVLLSCFVLIGIASVGWFYAPSAVLMIIAAIIQCLDLRSLLSRHSSRPS